MPGASVRMHHPGHRSSSECLKAVRAAGDRFRLWLGRLGTRGQMIRRSRAWCELRWTVIASSRTSGSWSSLDPAVSWTRFEPQLGAR